MSPARDEPRVELPSPSHQHPSPSKSAAAHPFAPLSADEIINASTLIQAQWPQNTDLRYKVVTLQEPPKAQVLPYLDAEHSSTDAQPTPLDRKASVAYYIRNTNKFHDAIVNLSTQSVESNVRLGPNIHGAGDNDEVMSVERIALQDPGFLQEIAKLQLPAGTVLICDPWCYGADGTTDDERLWQCFVYMRHPQHAKEEDANHYAHPLPISPVVCNSTMKVIRIDILPTGADATARPPKGPWSVHTPNEYDHKFQKLRTDVKPLHVSQPEGASFRVTQQGTSSLLDWQKWTFRVGFNQREGMVLYDVRYDGRPLFYRLSLSDMNIPYADPRFPFFKKSAFDLGDVGAGIMANNLKLGCDCLGSIHYLSGVLADDQGGLMEMPNVICIHEQDGGIGWKHVNYRSGNAAVVRNRELVLQSIITVSNYEYILAFMFNQAGELAYEVRATGILSTQPIDDGISVPWGTVVHPGVLATYHQHIFSLRIDPMLDGPTNRLVYEEALPMPRDSFNPMGTGYTTRETVIQRSGGFDLDANSNRTFKIQNNDSRNGINNKPVAYKIVAPAFQKILSDKDSFNYKRAEFSDRNIYAVAYRDGELYAGGQWTNQSRGGTGVRSWAERDEDILDRDLVVFVQFGMNHIPRIEDFPVMPCEVLKVTLKPVNFFDRNPALDVPPSTQVVNQSTLLSRAAGHAHGNGHGSVGYGTVAGTGTEHRQPSVVGTLGRDGSICCSSDVGASNGHARGNGHEIEHGNGNGNGNGNGHDHGHGH